MSIEQELTEQYKDFIRKLAEAHHWENEARREADTFHVAYYMGVRDTYTRVLKKLGVPNVMIASLVVVGLKEFREELVAQAESIEASA